ncbi:MAG TPA: hypothetical protein VFQ61_16555 [Polyangiaceae bacterium]|nr:hypothetical protein [Polyangiaceae bacterium]
MMNIYTLTPAAAQSNLQNDGLDTLGLTTLALSPRWSSAALSGADGSTRRMPISGSLRAPFRGLLSGLFAPARSTLASNVDANATTLQLASGEGARFPSPTGGGSVRLTLSNDSGSKRETLALTARSGDSLTVVRGFDGSAKQAFSSGDQVRLKVLPSSSSVQFTGAEGQPLTQACAVYRLHPQAVLRLERLMSARYSVPADSAVIRPIPTCIVIHEAEYYLTDQFFDADEVLPVTGSISFHDGRGLILDPIYVACLFEDLLAWLPALKPASVSASVNDTGGIHAAAQSASGNVVHCVSLHGSRLQLPLGTARLIRANSSGTALGDVPADGWLELGSGERIQAASSDENRLRWGWATNGTLGRAPLTVPTLPAGVSLNRQFFRVAAIDVRWALLGNRTSAEVLGVQADDQRIPPELLPEVREFVTIDYLPDGPDTLAEGTRVLQRPNLAMIAAVSPELDATLLTPSAPGAAAHWPTFPAAVGSPGATIPAAIPDGAITAAFVAAPSHDVVVTLTGVAPVAAHVRIYPQQFVVIPAIAEEPSFVRGDGGASIAGAGPVEVLLPNPFGLAAGASRPSPAQLVFDLVIAPRVGARRLFGALSVNVQSGPAAVPASPFTGAGPLAALPTTVQGLGPSPLFGVPLPAPPPPGPAPTNPIELAVSLATEPSPRQAPRLPTQARFETLLVTGTTGPGTPAPSGTLLWDAVISGARWARESRSAQHDLGNPGNPAGPDVHAPGVRVTGALAYDAALVALRRAQPIIPWPTTAGVNPGWVIFTAGDNFDVPDDSANTNNTGIGALLRTIAVGSETPQLSSQTPPAEGLTVQQLLQNAGSALGLSVPPNTISLDNEARIQKEIRREFFISKFGLRDAQWALLRAVSEARELIYIESPQFARTAWSSGAAQSYEIDLAAKLAARLDAAPHLKIIICTPRLSDFAPNFKAFSRQHYVARNEAISLLTAVAPDRVAVFHPVGFPGRTAYVRTTSVIVDDVWSLVGTAHLRRRGMTFDGSVSVASFDRQLQDGYSKKVRDYRRALMALKLRVPSPTAGQPPAADWIRLSRPDSAFALVRDLLAQSGLGRIQPLWPGPSDTTVLAAQPAAADPEGSTSDQFMVTLAGALNELGD